MSDSWTVVQFLEESTVEAVPSAWIVGNSCFWPPYTADKLTNAIKKAEPLNSCWPCHNIKIFRNATFDNYLAARSKARIAEENSEVETECDGANKKRRIFKKVYSSSEDSLDESSLATPPKIKRPARVHCGQAIVGETNVVLPAIESLDVSQSSGGGSSCNGCIEKDKVLKQLLQQGHMLRGMMIDLIAEVRTGFQRQIIKTDSPDTMESFFTASGISFPVTSEEAMLDFNTYLEDPRHFKNAVSELVKIGGSKPYEFISRVGKLTISNETALTYSWLGQRGKGNFSNMRVASLFIDALEAGKLISNRKEGEHTIKLWLRRAYDRYHYILNKRM